MWDTSEDYRLLVAKESVELFKRALRGAKFKGQWDKSGAEKKAGELLPIIEELRYSYMEPEEMAESSQIDDMKEIVGEIVDALGGEDWHREFRDRANKDDKRKVEEKIAEIRFFLNTIENLDQRLILGQVDDPVMGVDMRVGNVMSVSEHPETEGLHICNVDVGDRAVAVVTNDLEVEEDDNVAVSILPPSKFHGVTSEGMFLGAEDGVLRDVEGDVGELPEDIPLDAFNESRNLVNDFLD